MLHKDYEVAAFIQTVHGKHIFTVTHIPTHPNSGTDFYRHLSRQVFTQDGGEGAREFYIHM